VENLYSRVVAQPGLKRGTFSPDLLVPVATPRSKGPYQPGLKAVFLLVLVKVLPSFTPLKDLECFEIWVPIS
jgi:hypothetical protein